MTFEQAIALVSVKLGIPPAWLRNLIYTESRNNPLAKNPISGARGLIQFTNTTARALGYTNADNLVSKHPDAPEQITGPVLRYFQQPGLKPPYPSPQSFYMAAFLPIMRNKPAWTPIPEPYKSQNPGINTVQDYIDLAEGRGLKKAVKSNTGIILLLGLVALGYYLYKTH